MLGNVTAEFRNGQRIARLDLRGELVDCGQVRRCYTDGEHRLFIEPTGMAYLRRVGGDNVAVVHQAIPFSADRLLISDSWAFAAKAMASGVLLRFEEMAKVWCLQTGTSTVLVS